jgi:hypothetical protein
MQNGFISKNLQLKSLVLLTPDGRINITATDYVTSWYKFKSFRSIIPTVQKNILHKNHP